jgi:hypothetical protein
VAVAVGDSSIVDVNVAVEVIVSMDVEVAVGVSVCAEVAVTATGVEVTCSSVDGVQAEIIRKIKKMIL